MAGKGTVEWLDAQKQINDLQNQVQWQLFDPLINDRLTHVMLALPNERDILIFGGRYHKDDEANTWFIIDTVTEEASPVKHVTVLKEAVGAKLAYLA